MIAQCTPKTPGRQVSFNFPMSKEITADRLGGRLSVNGGVLLLREADDKIRLTQRLMDVVVDKRDDLMVKHRFSSLWRQSIYQRACGFEDINDSEITRKDPAFMVAAGNENPETGSELASTSTLQRFEYSITEQELKSLQKVLPEVFLDTFRKPPDLIRLASDTTCDPVHGDQQGACYNGFYGETCYTPMFVWEQDRRFPLAAVLRSGSAGPAEGSVRVLDPVVTPIRSRFPNTRIEYTADAVYAEPELLAFCERKDKLISYYIGIKSNHALEKKPEVKQAYERADREFKAIYGEPKPKSKKEWNREEQRIRCSSKEEGRQQELDEKQERRVRVFGECMYQAREWPAERRVVFRVERTDEKMDIRYVVTNDYRKYSPRWIYEEKYCKRSRCENWVREMKELHCDRLSCQEFDANQFRLLLHTFAYALLVYLHGLLPDDDSDMSVTSFMHRLIKVSVAVTETARTIKFRFSSWDPWACHSDYVLLRMRAT